MKKFSRSKFFTIKTKTTCPIRKCSRVKKLVLSLWALKRFAKFKFNPIILSRVIASTDTGQTEVRQTIS